MNGAVGRDRSWRSCAKKILYARDLHVEKASLMLPWQVVRIRVLRAAAGATPGAGAEHLERVAALGKGKGDPVHPISCHKPSVQGYLSTHVGSQDLSLPKRLLIGE